MRAGNLLARRELPTTVTVRSLVGTDAAHAVGTAPVVADAAAAEAWPELYEVATDEERVVLDLVRRADVVDAPELGVETESGVPLSLSWPDRRVVVDLDLDDDERDELTEDGWTVVPVDADAIRKTLSSAQERD